MELSTTKTRLIPRNAQQKGNAANVIVITL